MTLTETPFAALERALAARADYERQAPPPGAFGLERIERLMERLGHPEAAYPAVHVAGTKGKGTTAAAIASALDAAGLRVGLYTSPHLVDLRERIRIGALPAPDALWVEAGERVLAAAEELADDPPTWFELVTAIALEAFRRAEVEVAVVEVGLGGRLDATRVVRPEVCVITRIARDHVALLGEDEAQIAGEKAGILVPGVPVVAAPGHPAASAMIEARAAERGAPLWLLGRELRLEANNSTPGAVTVITPAGRLALRPPGPGATLREDLALAAAAVVRLGERLGRDLTPGLARGFGRLRWRGRFDVISGSPLIVIDGAHDAASAEALRATYGEALGGAGPVLLIGLLRDKDVAGVAAALAPLPRSVVACAPRHPRAAPPEAIAAPLRARGLEVEVAPDAAQGLARASARAIELGAPLLVAGSLMLAGEVLALLEQDTLPAWR